MMIKIRIHMLHVALQLEDGMQYVHGSTEARWVRWVTRVSSTCLVCPPLPAVSSLHAPLRISSLCAAFMVLTETVVYVSGPSVCTRQPDTPSRSWQLRHSRAQPCARARAGLTGYTSWTVRAVASFVCHPQPQRRCIQMGRCSLQSFCPRMG